MIGNDMIYDGGDSDGSTNWSGTQRPGNRFEIQCVCRYVINAVAARTKPDNLATLLDWLQVHHTALGFKLDPVSKSLWKDGREIHKVRRDVSRALVAAADRSAPAPASALENRLKWIAKTAGLSDREAKILKLAVRSAIYPVFGTFTKKLASNHSEYDEDIERVAIGPLLNLPPTVIRPLLTDSSPLIRLGLLEDRCSEVRPTGLVMRLAQCPTQDPSRLRKELFGCSRKSTLEPADFEHLGECRRIVTSLVAAALEKHERGVGVLLYGPPGTGKTEYAKVLAAEVGAQAVFIGETDDSDGEPTRGERIAHLTLTSALADRAGRTLLVVDEADDLFTGVDENALSRRDGSKVFMNRLVENCMAPTLWITNNTERLGPAAMRRMAFAIRFPEPGRSVRRRMIERIAGKRELNFGAGDFDRLERIEAAPALIDAGLRAASLTDGSVATTIAATESLTAALGTRPAVAMVAGPVPFDPALSTADCSLDELAERVQASFLAGERALSFCFYGIPGTGKSAYARFLAEKLDIEIIEKRASDILSMFVGGSEQNIADAFQEAADRRAMLVIDEADSLLQDRAGAQRSWEITQVNEMLTWIERHPYPLVCTTNAIDALDRATMRRFVFKVEFLPMTAGQVREAFRRTFGGDPPAELDRLDLLTPGDFAVVARRARVMCERDPARLVAMLAAEVLARQRGVKRKIGF